jgi:hypothetical protein
MQCVDFEQLMNEVLDDRLDPHVDPLLISHARQCEACQDLLDWNSAIVRAIPEAPAISEPLADRITISARREWWAHRTVWGGAVAAAVLLALVVNLPTTTPDSTPSVDTNDQVAEQRQNTDGSQIESFAIWAFIDQIPVEEKTRYVTVPIASGIRPIRNSLGVAFEALRETLPPNKRSVEPLHPQTGMVIPRTLNA